MLVCVRIYISAFPDNLLTNVHAYFANRCTIWSKSYLIDQLKQKSSAESIYVAVKYLENQNNVDAKMGKILSEITFLNKIEYHPNVATFIGQVASYLPMMIVTEYCSNHNLRDFLRTVSVISNLLNPLLNLLFISPGTKQFVGVVIRKTTGLYHANFTRHYASPSAQYSSSRHRRPKHCGHKRFVLQDCQFWFCGWGGFWCR